MPFLFCVVQHAALEAIQRGLNPNEKLLVFWTTCILRRNHRVGRLQIPPRKSCGPTAGSESMQGRHMFGTEHATSRRHVSLCRGWLKQWIPEHAFGEQGIKVLGTPVGHDDYVRQLLEKVQAKQQVLLDAIPRESQTCSQRGFFSSIALQRAPIINSRSRALAVSLCDSGGS